MSAVITLLTDFGTRDGYVGALKGVLSTRAPAASLVDLSHEIPRGDCAAASFALRQALPEFPAGTVHLVVVDPGVGSARRAIAAAIGEQHAVAPDNGVLSGVLCDEDLGSVRRIDPVALGLERISPVFHGRDIFAPAAAVLATGEELELLGPAIDPESLVRLPELRVERSGDEIRGAIQHIDRFGNLITNLRPPADGPLELRLGNRLLPLLRTYSDADEGALLALVGSHGFLEIACNAASAAEVSGASRGDVVTLRLLARS